MALRNDGLATRGAGVLAIAALVFNLGPMALGYQGGDEPRREAIPSDRGTDLLRGGARRDTVSLPAAASARLGIRVEPARAATRPGTLVLRGALAIDPANRVRIRPRFAGEVVEVGMTAGAEGGQRRLGQGDRVTSGQLLAIVWSSELSQIKNALLDAFSRVSLERETIARLGGLRKEGAISARDYQEARRELEESEIEAARQERSLRARGATAEDIAAVHAEAETVHARGGRSPFNPEKSWARFSIRSPIDGKLLDARAADGDTVEADEVVYQVADLSRLLVHVSLHESDLPAVEALPRPIRWTLRLEGRPDAEARGGVVESFGVEIDPSTRCATLMGMIENRDDRLHPGQSLTATIELPLDPSLVEIPQSARIGGDGPDRVFVQPDPEKPAFVLRTVRAARTAPGFLIVRDDAREGIRPGEKVVVAGTEQLKAILDGASPSPLSR